MEPFASYGAPTAERPRVYSFGLGLLSVVGLIAWFVASDTTSVRPARSDDYVNAWVFSQEFMKRQLDSASAGSFCGFDRSKVSFVSAGSSAGIDTYSVAGCVFVQDSSGTTLRKDFVCKLHKHGDLWHLDRITMVAG